MGGKIESVIHCDMVIKAPTIIVDGRTILKKGKLCFVDSDWQEAYSNITLSGSPLKTTVSVARSGMDTSLHNQTLSRILRPEPGRVSTCAVGNEETSRLAHDIYSLLPRDGEWIEIKDLSSNNSMDPDAIRRVLHLIWEYGLINYR